MSFERVIGYEAYCDDPECNEGTEMFLPAKYDKGRMAYARQCARAQGWTIRHDETAYCPKHKPQPQPCHRP